MYKLKGIRLYFSIIYRGTVQLLPATVAMPCSLNLSVCGKPHPAQFSEKTTNDTEGVRVPATQGYSRWSVRCSNSAKNIGCGPARNSVQSLDRN
jgi:hypothetical protein